jgi:uncharacterized protein (DUF302 family)
MRNTLFAAICAGLVAVPVAASEDDIIKRQATGTVLAVTDALVAAAEGAGATVFARVDHAKGAASTGVEMLPAQLVILGNPQLGTPAMQDNVLAGLYLPLRVLVYEDAGGQVWLAYEDPEETLEDLPGINDDAAYITRMRGALDTLTALAAGG